MTGLVERPVVPVPPPIASSSSVVAPVDRAAAPAPRARRGRSVRRMTLQGFVAFVVVVLAAVAVMVVGLVRLSSAVDVQTARWGPAAIRGSQALAGLLDQETGVRGYAVTGDPSYLEPYTEGLAAEAASLTELRSLIPASETRVRTAIENLATAGRTWRTSFAEPVVAAVRAGDQGTASRLVAEQSGKDLFDAVRSAADALNTGVVERRSVAVTQVRSAVTLLITTVAIAAGVVLVAAFVAWVTVRRRILDPVARLARDSREVTAGHLEHPVAGGGPAEIDDLAADVDAMRRRVVGELLEVERSRALAERTSASLARSNADLEQFAYVASHDLQEPLRKVSNFCQLLERQYAPQLDDRAGQYIHFAVDGAKRMQVLINDLLSFSRVGRNTETFEAVPLAEVVREALDNLAEPVRDTGAVVHVAADLPTLRVDRTLLVTLLQNLVGNAVKYHGDELPRVEVTARRRPMTVPPGVDDPTPRHEWVVSVADNGIGIEPQYAQRIFVIFQRLHLRDSYGGTGIGLAMCKKIVEFHGGTIWLEPSDPPGATFCFTVPDAPLQEDRPA